MKSGVHNLSIEVFSMLILLPVIAFFSCHTQYEKTLTGIPEGAELMDESPEYAVYVTCDDFVTIKPFEGKFGRGAQGPLKHEIEKIEETEILEQSLWLLNKKNGNVSKVLSSHLHTNCSWANFLTESVKRPKDSINAIESVRILPWSDPMKIIVEEQSDSRNVFSYIVTPGQDSVVYLPTSSGLVGFSKEELLIVMESYEYYKNGGRYSRLDIFDYNGRRVNSMNINERPDTSTMFLDEDFFDDQDESGNDIND